MIIDAHCHIGATAIFEEDISAEQLISAMDAHGIQAGVAQPFPGAPISEEEGHDLIAAAAQRYPGRIFGMASVRPYIGREAYRREVERCIRQLGFVAIKLHTIGHPVVPSSRIGMMVFETAAELGVPVMVHTGLGLPAAAPALVIPAARAYPDLPIILGHAGYGISSPEAIVIAREYPSIYLEPSWAPSKFVLGMVRAVDAERVMFGSDLPINVATELTKIRSIGLTPEEEAQVLESTARSVFGLPL